MSDVDEPGSAASMAPAQAAMTVVFVVALAPAQATLAREAVERGPPEHVRRGLQRLVLGSVTEYVFLHAHRPVHVLRPGEHEPRDGH